MTIQVVDALCGAGKTTWIFKHIMANKDKEWIFCSPYLNETGEGKVKGRIQKELPEMRFLSPESSPSKKASFLRGVGQNRNIAITHALFTGFSLDVAKVLEDKNYHLVIDETIDLITFYDDVKGDDVKIMIEWGMVLVGDKGRIDWNYTKYPDYNGRDNDIKELCDLGCLWLYGDNVMLQRIPPLALQACKSVTILTYMFEGSLMSAWMELNNIEWEYYNPPTLKPAKQLKEEMRDKLYLVKPSSVIDKMQTDTNGYPIHSVFNMSWYKAASVPELNEVKASIESTIKHNMISGNVFWTTFKQWELVLKGKGYTKGVRVDWLDGVRPTFLSKNTRASNEYRDCTKCIYTVNIYPNGSIESHLKTHGVTINRDLYALSELIQFVFRGAIRCNQDMDLLILSNRMRCLFETWLATDK